MATTNSVPLPPPRQPPSRRRPFAALLALAASCCLPPAAAAAAAVAIDDMTSTELQARIDAGATTVLVPIGGTEQNGPHMALGKHNVRALLLAERIAERLGNAVVAPVVNYVPEGDIQPPTQHMRWAGTISVPPAAFEAVLEGAARSLQQHGFRAIVFLGDHGGYQSNAERVARKLNAAFGGRAQVHLLAEYYRTTQTAYVAALRSRGISDAEIGSHAGLADTALTLAVAPALVRLPVAAARQPGAHDGVSGDPRRATAELGRLGADSVVDASVAAIQAMTKDRQR